MYLIMETWSQRFENMFGHFYRISDCQIFSWNDLVSIHIVLEDPDSTLYFQIFGTIHEFRNSLGSVIDPFMADAATVAGEAR